MDKPNHVSLDRPKVAPLEGGLPIGAVPYGPRSSWPLIVIALWEGRGTWHVLGKHLKHPASALTSARKWCDILLPVDASENIEIAYRPLANGRVEVYLRIRNPGQEPLFVPEDDDDDEEVEPVSPIVEEPSGNRREGSLLAPPETPKARPGSLSETDVRAIRLKREAGVTLKELSQQYGLSQSTLSMVANRKAYAWVNGDEE